MKKATLFATILALVLSAQAQTVVVIGPTAPKKPGPVARYSENAIADAGTVQPPIKKPGPTAPKKPGPVARYSENTIADAGTVQPPIKKPGPTAPKKPGPVARYSESATA